MELIEYVLSIIEGSPHLVVFILLFSCGLGLPLPEEVTLIAAAWASIKGWSHLYLMFLVCVSAILGGDLATYMVGRIFGYRLVRLPYFRKILSEARLQRVDRFFDKYGDWTVFICRFFAGFRFACYFIAGISRLRFHIFLLMDAFGAFLSVGLTFWIIYRFGLHIEKAIFIIKKAHNAIILAILFTLFSVIAWKIWKSIQAKKLDKEQQVPQDDDGPPSKA